MKILVLGGSYFLGRYFTELAAPENELTIYNRGNNPLRKDGVREVIGDRHSATELAQLKGMAFDAVVDFCAYSEGDICRIFDVVGDGINQYIFISTVDVYKRGLGKILDENSPFETCDFGGEAGTYILGKVCLEKEIVECCEKHGARYTVIRPAFIYGPGNYAPRESIFFDWIARAKQILYPIDATGEFQLVYVMDVAKAIYKAINNENAYNEAFNITGEKIETYESFTEALEKVVPVEFEKIPVTIDVVNERGIPLPFPLTKEESNICAGTKSQELIEKYTPFEEGIKITARSYFG